MLTICAFRGACFMCRVFSRGCLSRAFRRRGKLLLQRALPTDSQRSTLAACEDSLFARDIAAQLSRFADENKTRGFAAAWISAWLTAEGFMEQTEQGKRATELGAELGIETLQREHADGTPYLVNKYNTQAQQFILDNFDVIVAFKAKRKEQS